MNGSQDKPFKFFTDKKITNQKTGKKIQTDIQKDGQYRRNIINTQVTVKRLNICVAGLP